MFLTKPYKVLPFCKRRNLTKGNENNTSLIFEANNINYLQEIMCVKLSFLVCSSAPKLLIKTPSRFQTPHSKPEISNTIIQKYPQDYSEPKIGRKIKYSTSARKTIFVYEKVYLEGKISMYIFLTCSCRFLINVA